MGQGHFGYQIVHLQCNLVQQEEGTCKPLAERRFPRGIPQEGRAAEVFSFSLCCSRAFKQSCFLVSRLPTSHSLCPLGAKEVGWKAFTAGKIFSPRGTPSSPLLSSFLLFPKDRSGKWSSKRVQKMTDWLLLLKAPNQGPEMLS